MSLRSVHPALPLALAAVFALLSALHVFWAAGGSLGTGAAIPSVGGRPVFRPGPAATLAVALGLALAAALVLAQARLVRLGLPPRLTLAGTLLLGAVFVLRAVGDFRLVGFFKSVRGTPFARWDTALFSPLCLLLGLGALGLAWATRGE